MKFKLRPRGPGDPAIPAELEPQLRAAGIDPAKMTLVPTEGGASVGAALTALPATGTRLRHAFAFATLNAALAAIERVLDDDVVATIAKESAAWLVAFDSADDPNVDDTAEHVRFAERVTPLGATDRGFAREVLTRTAIRR